MRIYSTPTSGECVIQAVLPKFAIAIDHSNKDPQRLSRDRLKYLLLDVCLFVLFGAGLLRYYAAAIASPTVTRVDILAQLENDEIELSWAKQHIDEMGESTKRRDGKWLTEAVITDLENEHELRKKEQRKVKEMKKTNDANERLKAELLQEKILLKEGVMPGLRGKSNQQWTFKFQQFDVVEIDSPYDSNKEFEFMFAPFKVASAHIEDDGDVYYDLINANDGHTFAIKEKSLHLYEPYAKGTEALCNIGNFKENKFQPCNVLSFSFGAKISNQLLQERYVVQLFRNDESYTASIPVWMMRRLR